MHGACSLHLYDQCRIFSVPKNRLDVKANERVNALLKLTLLLVDKVRKYRLSREVGALMVGAPEFDSP